MCDEISLGLAPAVVKEVYAALEASFAREDGLSAMLLVEQDIELARTHVGSRLLLHARYRLARRSELGGALARSDFRRLLRRLMMTRVVNWLDTDHSGNATGGSLRTFRNGPRRHLRRHAADQYRARRLHRARGVCSHSRIVRRDGLASVSRDCRWLLVGFCAVRLRAVQRTVLNRTLGNDILPPLVVTYGLSIVIENVLAADRNRRIARSLKIGSLETASITAGRGACGRLCFRLIVLRRRPMRRRRPCSRSSSTELALAWAFRAVSDDREIASIDGRSRSSRLFGYAAAISFAVIAIAGVFMGVKFTFNPTLGPKLSAVRV